MHTCYYRCGGKLTLLWKLVIIKFRALGIKGGYKKLFQGEFQVPSISKFLPFPIFPFHSPGKICDSTLNTRNSVR